MTRTLIAALLSLGLAATAHAGPEDFHPGTAIPDFGKIADVASADAIPADTVFKVAFDVAKAADEGQTNRNFDSAARFINMHVAAGVPLDQIHVAIVVHGPAASDLTDREDNASAALIAALIDSGASITLCGQTAAYRDIAASDLLPGVSMSLSAMTAHAQLQQDGYTLNPF